MKTEYKTMLAVLLLLALLGVWVARNTYWSSEEVTLPMQRVAAMNPNYSLAVLVRTLGASVQHAALSGAVTPSKGAILILTNISSQYGAEREARIRSWIENGGQAVISADLLAAMPTLAAWADVVPYDVAQEGGRTGAGKIAAHSAEDSDCPVWRSAAGNEHYRVCTFGHKNVLLINRETQWEMRDESGTQIARMGIGNGSLTIISSADAFSNLQLRRGDNARLFVRATGFKAGDAVWFVDPKLRESLLRLLWRVAAPALLVALGLALLLLWRMTDRLGPLKADPGSARRSLREQIAGNANFAWRMHDLRGLFAAQRRALNEAAARRIRNFRAMNWHDQAESVASLGGGDAKNLLAAMVDSAGQDRLVLRDYLARLESARRRLMSDIKP